VCVCGFAVELRHGWKTWCSLATKQLWNKPQLRYCQKVALPLSIPTEDELRNGETHLPWEIEVRVITDSIASIDQPRLLTLGFNSANVSCTCIIISQYIITGGRTDWYQYPWICRTQSRTWLSRPTPWSPRRNPYLQHPRLQIRFYLRYQRPRPNRSPRHFQQYQACCWRLLPTSMLLLSN